MATRLFALIAGLIYTGMGILAFLPPFLWPPERPHLWMSDLRLDGAFLGGFVAVNLPHNILWIIMGVGGLIGATTYTTSKLYGQGLFVATLLLTFWGLLPIGIGDLWGYLPLSSWNIMIHCVTAMLAWYYGFVWPRDAELGIA